MSQGFCCDLVDGGEADDAPEHSQRAALFGRAAQCRDDVWRDVLDPDLCLADPVGYGIAVRRRLPHLICRVWQLCVAFFVRHAASSLR